MAFRDDELATKSRVDVLKLELEELRAENTALKEAKASSRTKKSSVPSWMWVALVAALGIAAIGAWRVSTHGDELSALLVALGIVTAMMTPMFFLMRSILVVVRPGRIAVLSGRDRVAADGKTYGFRIVTSGRTIRIPILEHYDELNGGPFGVETTLHNVYTKSADQTNVQIRAELSVTRDEPYLVKAVERFVGRDENEIATVGRETLEGAARGIIAHLTLHELREDRMKIEETLMKEVQSDLDRLGLTLESFYILEVTKL
jgi:flotillin